MIKDNCNHQYDVLTDIIIIIDPQAPAKDPPAKDAEDPPAKVPAKDVDEPPAKNATTKQPDNSKQPTGGKLPTNGTENETPKNQNPNAPTVQVQIIEPKAAKDILYKIGQNITFRWKYSDKFVNQPKVITVQAQPLINQKNFYFIANITAVNDINVAFWDTNAEASSLPMADYKLWICDERGIDAVPKAGGLQVFSNLQFGLYQPQKNERK